MLITRGDSREDWLRAGQALHRLLAHAAANWVFASLHTQPLEADVIRALIQERLALPGAPQILLQLGLAHTAHATARRPRRADRALTPAPIRWGAVRARQLGPAGGRVRRAQDLVVQGREGAFPDHQQLVHLDVDAAIGCGPMITLRGVRAGGPAGPG